MGKEQKLTPWFPPAVEPVRDGIYETRPVPSRWSDDFVWHAVWRSGEWCGPTACGPDVALAYAAGGQKNRDGPLEWRGLAEKPE